MTKNVELIDLCKNLKEDTLNSFEDQIMQVTDLHSTFGDEIQELNKVFGNNTYMDKIECLENVLETFMDKLSDETLAHLLKISFKAINKGDSYGYTILIVKHALKNSNVAIQNAMAKAFVDAQEYYDPGHREWEANVYETLIDDLLKEFDEKPLASVLLHSNINIFSDTGGDDARNLFYAFFAKATNKEVASKVLDRFIKFSFSELVHGKFYSDSFIDNLEEIADSIISNELVRLKPFFKLYMAGFVEFDEEETPEFLKSACQNKDLVKMIDWTDIYYGETGEDFEFDYELVYETLLYLTNEKSKAAYFFFNFAYYLDKDRLKEDFAKEVNNPEVMENIRHHNAFESDRDEFNTYVATITGMLAGKSEEDVITERVKNEQETKEREERNSEDRRLKAELITLIEKAKEDLHFLDEYIELSENLAANYPYDCSKRTNFAIGTSALLLKTLQSGELDSAKKVFYSYVDTILPHVGLMTKVTDVASLAIVLSIFTKDDDIFDRVINDILIGEFAVTKIDNNSTLYNLSCYYAKKEDKENMLNVIALAVKHGKEADTFLNEKDFAIYHKDSEFLDAIGN